MVVKYLHPYLLSLSFIVDHAIFLMVLDFLLEA